jgi:hypothetical protein
MGSQSDRTVDITKAKQSHLQAINSDKKPMWQVCARILPTGRLSANRTIGCVSEQESDAPAHIMMSKEIDVGARPFHGVGRVFKSRAATLWKGEG